MSKKIRLLLVVTLCFYTACVSPVRRNSFLDAQYRLVKSSKVSPHTPSQVVKTYQTFISASLGSDCPMYPSCSRYAQLVTSKCGHLEGVLMSSARLQMEFDAQIIGFPIILINRKILYEDIPYCCHF